MKYEMSNITDTKFREVWVNEQSRRVYADLKSHYFMVLFYERTAMVDVRFEKKPGFFPSFSIPTFEMVASAKNRLVDGQHAIITEAQTYELTSKDVSLLGITNESNAHQLASDISKYVTRLIEQDCDSDLIRHMGPISIDFEDWFSDLSIDSKTFIKDVVLPAIDSDIVDRWGVDGPDFGRFTLEPSMVNDVFGSMIPEFPVAAIMYSPLEGERVFAGVPKKVTHQKAKYFDMMSFMSTVIYRALVFKWCEWLEKKGSENAYEWVNFGVDVLPTDILLKLYELEQDVFDTRFGFHLASEPHRWSVSMKDANFNSDSLESINVLASIPQNSNSRSHTEFKMNISMSDFSDARLLNKNAFSYLRHLFDVSYPYYFVQSSKPKTQIYSQLELRYESEHTFECLSSPVSDKLASIFKKAQR